jgi:fluoride exporter
MQRFLIVCLAGGLGSGARYLVSLAAGDKPGEGFPMGTLIVNVVGSLMIAFVFGLALRQKVLSSQMELALTTGFMGGFTTYSSFNYQTTALWDRGSHALAGVNIAVTLVVCLAAGLAGGWLAKQVA